MASDKVKLVSDGEFDSVIASDTPCLIDFWAPLVWSMQGHWPGCRSPGR